MTDHLLAMAARQHGIVTSADVARAAVSASDLAALVRSGVLHPLRRGVHVVRADWESASPEARLALRTRGILLHRDGSAEQEHGEVAFHHSALAVHGLPLHGVGFEVVDLMGDVARVRRDGTLRVHPRDARLATVVIDGCRTVTTAAALAQVAVREGRVPFVVAADAALARRRTTSEQITEAVLHLARTPRQAVRAQRWIAECDPASESVGESRTRLLLTDLGHCPRTQVRVADDSGAVFARPDFLIGDRVIVEFDGLVKYAGLEGREALAAEKIREDRLRANGYEVVRLTWADLDNPRRVDALIRAALARAAARGRRPAS